MQDKEEDIDEMGVANFRGKVEEPDPLVSVRWHRVIIDEAHNIRNSSAACSKAVSKLQAKYRWCLTATPVVNCINDDAYLLWRQLCHDTV